MIQTTVGVGGMMCDMCEVHIADAIRRNFDVKKAKSNRHKNQCVVVPEQELDADKLKSVIEDLGYEFTGAVSEPYKKRGLLGLFG